MSNNLTDARAQLDDVAADVRVLQTRRADLLAELAEVDAKERDASARASTLASEIQRLEREPAARAQLERLLPTLHARLAKAPSTSPTVRDIRSKLGGLADERSPAADRLALAKDLLSDINDCYRLDRESWDRNAPVVVGREPRR